MSRKSQAIVAAAVILAALIGWKVFGGREESDEARIAAVVRSAADAVERRRASEAVSYLHPDFYSGQFRVDRKTTEEIMRQMFLMYQELKVQVRGVDVELTGDGSAVARCVATVQGVRRGHDRQEDLSRYLGSERLLFTFALFEDEWKIINVATIRSTAD